MKIHTYERFWLAGSMVLIVAFIVTITYGTVGLGITMIGDEEEALPPGEIDEDDRFEDPRVEQVGENEYEAYVVAQTFLFRPEPIEIPAGNEVTFYVTARDVIHSFTVVGTNTNTMVIPGEVSTMTVEFEEPGEYGVICNEYCGSGHHDMEGQLIVHPEDEFDLTSIEVEAPEQVDPDEEFEIDATVENGLFEDLETTVALEIGDETLEEDVTVPGESAETVTFTVDAADLGEDDHDWTVTVDDETESDTVTVGVDEDDEEDEGDEAEAGDGDDDGGADE
ncbi:cytochrome c oxidase subunit II [Natrarchaeobaculum aegyptiacum]|uniref:Cytochrome C oxidase subunit II n=1 Tax=Natrarchaeobaculum aegyptiacum TaxID=745377 RepID=A0A2Z2HXQ4_9EURY|nr:cytochrome c oxidase subunit II [Natrarchaeobaculum aegyptiacum]ARS91035.1 cytochrome C oxidase subunit II [Natrarchaeobaculum aegyptiacum]